MCLVKDKLLYSFLHIMTVKINCHQRQFVKKLICYYKYTHNVNESKGRMIFV
jgi:hypothetical protein